MPRIRVKKGFVLLLVERVILFLLIAIPLENNFKTLLSFYQLQFPGQPQQAFSLFGSVANKVEPGGSLIYHHRQKFNAQGMELGSDNKDFLLLDFGQPARLPSLQEGESIAIQVSIPPAGRADGAMLTLYSESDGGSAFPSKFLGFDPVQGSLQFRLYNAANDSYGFVSKPLPSLDDLYLVQTFDYQTGEILTYLDGQLFHRFQTTSGVGLNPRSSRFFSLGGDWAGRGQALAGSYRNLGFFGQRLNGDQVLVLTQDLKAKTSYEKTVYRSLRGLFYGALALYLALLLRPFWPFFLQKGPEAFQKLRRSCNRSYIALTLTFVALKLTFDRWFLFPRRINGAVLEFCEENSVSVAQLSSRQILNSSFQLIHPQYPVPRSIDYLRGRIDEFLDRPKNPRSN